MMNRVFDGRKKNCGVCGVPLGRVYFRHRELRIYLCSVCAEEFDQDDLVIYFDYRKKRNEVSIQGLNYLRV